MPLECSFRKLIFPVSVCCNYFIMENIPAQKISIYRNIVVYRNIAYIVEGNREGWQGIKVEFNQCPQM